ncbi:hypothetical protein BDV36DRAFT_268163 [Aspergillus pseudocaelatus]|uniref:Uncharacterized protein n=1 Tax=Aspergillus pseudocaelatus TaxID=1825620 RepID=A0ABQ6W8W5_9EURO|nr:hypothetical protein BDV36DRAFT_268163 [Aspergillus pseudocaelatus]
MASRESLLTNRYPQSHPRGARLSSQDPRLPASSSKMTISVASKTPLYRSVSSESAEQPDEEQVPLPETLR